MSTPLKLMAVLAHPDDESLGMGGTFAKYADEGIDCCLVTATRGERGRCGNVAERPSDEEVGKIREAELQCAVKKLGINRLEFLDYVDADLDKADHTEAIRKIATLIRDFCPDVVVTFGPDGGYGHPDHIAISQFTGAAIVVAADSNEKLHDSSKNILPTHAVKKFYYMTWTKKQWDGYQEAFKDLKMVVDTVERRAIPAPDWLITTRLNTEAYTDQVWSAVCCHESQMAIYEKLNELSPENHRGLWGVQEYYRVFSRVNSGRKLEQDLFEGLR